MIILQKFSHCSPLQPIAAHCSSFFHAIFSPGGYFFKSPTMAAQCSPLLQGKFSQRSDSSKAFPLQPNAAHPFLLFLVREGNSSKILPLQPIAAHSYMALLVREGNSSKVLPWQPLAAHSYMAILVSVGNSSKVLPLQPVAAHSYDAILVEGVI